MSHTVEILSVGTELLLGNIVNLDAQILSQGLSALGLNVYWHTVVGDNPQRAREAVAAAKGRADIIITTGGLGPTCDDLTKNVLAEAFGKKLVFHEPSAQRIRNYFARTGRPMTENNLQQAMLPEGCTVLVNDWGTAPGVAFEADGVRVIMLPGPPSECRPMFQHRVVPYLQALSEGVIASHTLKLFGIGESQMEAQLRDEMNAMSNPTLAPYAKEGECELRVTAKAPTMEQAQALLLPKVEELKARFIGLERGAPRTLRPVRYTPAVTLKKKATEQNHLTLAFPGLPYGHEKRFTLQLLSTMLGSGMSSRLIFSNLDER